MTGSRAWLIAVAVSLLALPTAAEEQPGDPVSSAGHWTFTADIGMGCSFSGTAALQQVEDTLYTGELTARQSCPMLEDDYLVRQECQARMIGRQVSVRCTIAEFINGFESAYYYPDNFTLTLASPDRMHGALVSSGDANPAEWRRAEGGIS